MFLRCLFPVCYEFRTSSGGSSAPSNAQLEWSSLQKTLLLLMFTA